MGKDETRVVAAIRAWAEQHSDVLKLWRCNSGRRAGVSFGMKGAADLTGVLTVSHIGDSGKNNGIRLEIECKAPGGVQSADQREFQQMIERYGGIYVLAESVEDVERALEGYL